MLFYLSLIICLHNYEKPLIPSDTNNFHTIIGFQVFLSNTNNLYTI